MFSSKTLVVSMVLWLNCVPPNFCVEGLPPVQLFRVRKMRSWEGGPDRTQSEPACSLSAVSRWSCTSQEEAPGTKQARTWPWTSGLRSCKEINLCVSLPVSGVLLRHPSRLRHTVSWIQNPEIFGNKSIDFFGLIILLLLVSRPLFINCRTLAASRS